MLISRIQRPPRLNFENWEKGEASSLLASNGDWFLEDIDHIFGRLLFLAESPVFAPKYMKFLARGLRPNITEENPLVLDWAQAELGCLGEQIATYCPGYIRWLRISVHFCRTMRFAPAQKKVVKIDGPDAGRQIPFVVWTWPQAVVVVPAKKSAQPPSDAYLSRALRQLSYTVGPESSTRRCFINVCETEEFELWWDVGGAGNFLPKPVSPMAACTYLCTLAGATSEIAASAEAHARLALRTREVLQQSEDSSFFKQGEGRLALIHLFCLLGSLFPISRQ